ncbi:MAG: hypothetical protein C0508_14725 [Cyanobacteria bacterium PR.023]|nr:hypothetical protein [Cyanobacteria bacterium PR.023]
MGISYFVLLLLLHKVAIGNKKILTGWEYHSQDCCRKAGQPDAFWAIDCPANLDFTHGGGSRANWC